MGIQQRNGNRRTAGSGRWMGMGGLSDEMNPAAGLSRSVTVTQQNRVLLLQIKTNESVPSENLDL